MGPHMSCEGEGFGLPSPAPEELAITLTLAEHAHPTFNLTMEVVATELTTKSTASAHVEAHIRVLAVNDAPYLSLPSGAVAGSPPLATDEDEPLWLRVFVMDVDAIELRLEVSATHGSVAIDDDQDLEGDSGGGGLGGTRSLRSWGPARACAGSQFTPGG